MEIKIGSYTGDGLDARTITGLGFQPDFVMIKKQGFESGGGVTFRTSTMTGDNSKEVGATAGLEANLVESLDSDGFTVGTDGRVNASGQTYHWVGIAAHSNDMEVGSYVGNATDDRTISLTASFTPDMVLILPATTQGCCVRGSHDSGDDSNTWDGNNGGSNRVQALSAGGFQVGTHAQVNSNSTTYHYLALANVSGFVDIGSYVGDGTTSRAITGVGFQPDAVICQEINAAFKDEGVFRTNAHTGSNSASLGASGGTTTAIQSLDSDGFTVDNNSATNSNGDTIGYWAFKDGNTQGGATIRRGGSMLITKGSTDVSVVLRIVDSTDGTPETGVVFNTTGIDLWYRREGAAAVAITEADLAALTTAHTDGGFKHIDDGYYRLDLPDAAFATGTDGVQIGGTVTGMIVFGPYVQLTDIDLFDVVRAGMTALPNAAADAAGGLPISDAGGLDLDTQIGTDIDAILVDTAALNDTKVPDTISLAAINAEVDSALNTAIPGSPTADSINQRVAAIDDLTQASGAGDLAAILADTNELQTDWANGGRLDLLVDAVKAKTDNLPSGIAKNVALSNFPFTMVDATDFATPETGLTVTAQVSKDGAPFAAMTNAVAEVGNGVYTIDITAAEMNADTVSLKFTATGAAQRVVVLKTDA